MSARTENKKRRNGNGTNRDADRSRALRGLRTSSIGKVPESRILAQSSIQSPKRTEGLSAYSTLRAPARHQWHCPSMSISNMQTARGMRFPVAWDTQTVRDLSPDPARHHCCCYLSVSSCFFHYACQPCDRQLVTAFGPWRWVQSRDGKRDAQASAGDGLRRRVRRYVFFFYGGGTYFVLL